MRAARLTLLALGLGCEVTPSVPPVPGESTPRGIQLPVPAAETGLSGIVYDARTLAPLVGAAIRTEPPTREVVSGPGGIFVLAPVPPNTYTVHAALAGFAENFASVRVEEGRGSIADLPLDVARPELRASPLTLELGETSEQQSFVVENVGPPGTTLSWSIAGGEPWIVAVEPRSGTLGAGARAIVELRVDRAQLGDRYGAFSSLLSVVSDGGDAQVAVRVSRPDPNRPHLSYEYSVYDFGVGAGVGSVTLTNDGTGDLTWRASADVAWIEVDPGTGTIPTGGQVVVRLTPNRAGLPPGQSFDGALTFESNSVLDDTIPLGLHLDTPHVYGWSVPSGPLGFGVDRIDVAIPIEKRSSDSLDWSARAVGAAPWLHLEPPAGRILPGQTQTLFALVDRDQLPAGPFSASVEVTAPRVGTVTVSLGGTQVLTPDIAFTRAVLLPYQGDEASEGKIYVTNLGQGTIEWTVTTTTPWLEIVGPASGASVDRGCVFLSSDVSCGEEVSLRAARAAFSAPGNYVGSLRLDDHTGGGTYSIEVRISVRDLHFETLPVEPRLDGIEGAGAAYDPIGDRVIVYGGRPNSAASRALALGDTYSFDGSSWRQLTNASGPPPMVHPKVVYDARRDRVVMFGGQKPPPAGNLLVPVEETWELIGESWVETATGGAPWHQGVSVETAVFDPGRGQIVAYGSRDACSASHVPDQRLFAYDGRGWRVLPVNPPDACDAVLVHFGGRLVVQTRAGSFRHLTEAWAEDSTLGFRRVADLPIMNYVYGQPKVDPGSGRLVELSGARLNFSTLEMHPVFAVGHVPGSQLPAYEVSGEEGFYTQFARGTDRGFLLTLPYEERVFHAVAFDSRRNRALAVGGSCGRTWRGYVGDPCTDGFALVLSLHGAPPEAPAIAVDATELTLPAGQDLAALTISNVGSGTLDLAAVPPAGLAASPDFGRVPAGASLGILLTVDRARLGPLPATLEWTLASDGGERRVIVTVE